MEKEKKRRKNGQCAVKLNYAKKRGKIIKNCGKNKNVFHIHFLSFVFNLFACVEMILTIYIVRGMFIV